MRNVQGSTRASPWYILGATCTDNMFVVSLYNGLSTDMFMVLLYSGFCTDMSMKLLVVVL